MTDSDGDGLTDDEEGAQGTDPLSEDTDGGSVLDGDEVANGTNPLESIDDILDTSADGARAAPAQPRCPDSTPLSPTTAR